MRKIKKIAITFSPNELALIQKALERHKHRSNIIAAQINDEMGIQSDIRDSSLEYVAEIKGIEEKIYSIRTNLKTTTIKIVRNTPR